MLFNSFVFLFAFLPIAYVVFWQLRTAQQRYVWLTVTGYVFYGYWDPRFCLLMAFSTLVSYLAGLALLRSQTHHARRITLIVPICLDLALLAFFKYAGFGLRTASSILKLCGVDVTLPVLDIVLPVGISFYTFHTISYIIDCYRGVVRPTRNFWEFSAYVSLFSQLVAGPIVRFRQIEKDLENLGHVDRTQWLALGVSYFVVGLLEKVVLADSLAQFVDPAFLHWHSLSTAGAWVAMLAYSFQLYFDFCGYSDMAIGLGFMFGLRIPINFNSPYKSLNPSDFWRRWHISLSTCLRDYLYISLGGNRDGELMTYRNLMLTMLIGGLWHGANFTFIVWGAYHGVLLIAYRRWPQAWDSLPKPLAQLLTFVLVLIGWVFFRADSLSVAVHFLELMFVPHHGEMLENIGLLAFLLAIAAYWAMIGRNTQEWNQSRTFDLRYAAGLGLAFGGAVALIAGGRNSPFLYFQF